MKIRDENLILLKKLFAVPVVLIKKITSLIKHFRNKFVEKLRFSLTFKIMIGYMFTIGLVLTLLSSMIIGGFIVYAGWNVEMHLQRDYQLISDYLKENKDIPEGKLENLSHIENISITLFDENKKVLYTTEGETDFVTFYDKNEQQELTLNGNYMFIQDNDKIYVDLENLNESSNNFGVAMLINNKLQWQSKDIYIQIKDRLINEICSLIVIAILLLIVDILFIVVVLFFGSRASKKTLKPIQTMTNIVENITIKELDTRLDIRGSQDELKDLARTFNNMLDRIEQSYEQQNQFVSDASHELRTPISVIQGYVNMLDRWGKEDKSVLDESISAIKTEAESMKSLIEKLLFLARGDKNTQKIEKEKFYINELIDEIVKETRIIDDKHEIKNNKNDVSTINADRKLLKEALRVFIDNSIKYTPEEGTITIDSVFLNNGVLISIEDTGMGISKEDLPHIFDRFYRADKSRTKQTGGTGLGLAIAKWIIFKHQGTINVQSKINVGTKVEIILPYNY